MFLFVYWGKKGTKVDTPTKFNSKSTFQKGPFHLESNLSNMIFQGASCEISRVYRGLKIETPQISMGPTGSEKKNRGFPQKTSRSQQPEAM